MAVVQPLYPVNGALWNDYVKADGADGLTASDTACNAASDGPGYGACVHGGEKRVATVPGYASCSGLTAADLLGAFDWACLDANGTVRVISTGLKASAHLADLVDFSAGAWRTNSVVVSMGGTQVFTSPPERWWSNPVRLAPAGTFTAPPVIHQVILLPMGATGRMDSGSIVDKVAVVSEPGSRFPGPTSVLGNFLWVEMRSNNNSINVGTGRFSVVRGADASGTGTASKFSAQGIGASIIDDVVVSNGSAGQGTGASFLNVTGTRVRRVSVTNPAGGIYVGPVSGSAPGATDSTFEDLTAINATGGFLVDYTQRTSFKNLVSLGTRGNPGLNIGNNAVDCTFDGVSSHAATGNFGGGVKSFGLRTRLRHVTVLGSEKTGVQINDNAAIYDDVLVVRAGAGGFSVELGGNHNVLHNARMFDQLGTGAAFNIASSSDVRVANVLIAGAKVGMSSAVGPPAGGVVRNVTVANVARDTVLGQTTGSGVYSSGSGFHTIHNLLTVNTHFGLNVAFAAGRPVLFQNAVLLGTEAETVVMANNGGSINFGGVLRLGRDGTGTGTTRFCSVVASATGLSPTCTQEAPSTASISYDHLDTNAFVGPVTSDTANMGDTNGTALFDGMLDFEHFDSVTRGWGKTGASMWPGIDQRGACSTGDTCQIFDFALKAGSPAMDVVTAIPGGTDVAVAYARLVSSDPATQADCDMVAPGSVFVPGSPAVCETRYLRDAVEVMGDAVGDDDTLCESGETCLFSPNAGYYQGHGMLVSAGGFAPGVITGVTLLKYETNGM